MVAGENRRETEAKVEMVQASHMGNWDLLSAVWLDKGKRSPERLTCSA